MIVSGLFGGLTGARSTTIEGWQRQAAMIMMRAKRPVATCIPKKEMVGRAAKPMAVFIVIDWERNTANIEEEAMDKQ